MRLHEMGEFDLNGAITALRLNESEQTKDKVEGHQPDIMDRYDMTHGMDFLHWSDAVLALPVLAGVIGTTYLCHLLNNFKLLCQNSRK